MADVATNLKQLAEGRFDQDIWPAEQKLFEAAASGEDADCTEFEEKDRIIRADRLSWLCTNPEAAAQATHRGLSIIGADIAGNLDLRWAKISFPIVTFHCFFSGAIDLSNSQIAFLNLGGSSVSHLKANETHFGGSVHLHNEFNAWGGVDLVGAKIGGDLDCSGGQFIGNRRVPALDANGVEVEGSVVLRNGFNAWGGVYLLAAKIGGNLDCSGSQFIGKDPDPALYANTAEVKGSVYLRDAFKADGEVNFMGAKIAGELDCSGGQFVSSEIPALTPSLNANRAKIEDNVSLRDGFKAEGGVNLGGAKIGWGSRLFGRAVYWESQVGACPRRCWRQN
jgi:hypothetical protein